MSLAAIGALLWLVPLAGVILLLYLLKMRRRDVKVPATFLWPHKVEEVRANALFQRLRPSWLLFLQLLALALIVFALARPQSMQRGLTGEVTVLVLDTSASMSATDVKPSRFEEARRLAADAIQGLRPGDRLALIEAGASPRVVFALGNDPAKQLRALETVTATDAEGSVGEALRLAAALAGSVEAARIVLLSDGVFDPVRDFSPGKAALVYKAIGSYDDNLAITALGSAETPGGRQLYCEVRNFGTKPINGTLTLVADGNPIDSVKLPGIGPKQNWGKTVSAPPGARVFEATLDAPDALKSDNYAVSVSDPSAKLRVLLVGAGNPFLERALGLDPRVTLDRSPTLPTNGDTYDIVVFDGVKEQPVEARGVLAFGAPGANSPATASATVAKPAFISAEEHPLMDGVDLAGIYIESQHKLSPRADARVLAQTAAGPVIVARESSGKRQVLVGFEPLDSDFPLQVAFPIFVANALDYLGGSGAASFLAVKAGQPFSVPWTEPAVLNGPEGFRADVNPLGGAVVVREARRVGSYELKSGSLRKQIYASLRSDRESTIAPVQNVSLGGGTVKATAAPMRFADFWRPLALLALLVLAGEWWLFARKS